jgi:hypothetical protein
LDRLKNSPAVLASSRRAGTASIRQSHWIPADERELGEAVHALLGAYLTGDPEAALGMLSKHSLEAIHRRVTAADLRDVLAQRGILPSGVAQDQDLAARLRQCQEDYYEDGTRRLIASVEAGLTTPRVHWTPALGRTTSAIPPTALGRIVLGIAGLPLSQSWT